MRAAGSGACAAIVAALALASCGSDADPRAELAGSLNGLASPDPAVLCQKTLSRRLSREIYGGVDKCLAAERAARATATARTARITNVRVKGDRGSAYVVLRGGDGSDTSGGEMRGGVSAVREAGGWRLDRFSTTFLRSGLKAGLVGNPQIAPDLQACLGEQVDLLDDAALRRLALGAMGADPAALGEMQGLIRGCVEKVAPSGGDVS